MNEFIDESLAAWTRATDTWFRASTEFARDAADANRRAAAVFGVDVGGGGAEPVESAAYTDADWTVERTVDAVADIDVGDWVRFEKPLADDDVRAFAHASGDTNRLHLDDAYAAETRFGERIVHGTLVAGLVSAALARLPGVTIYVEQDVEYLAPVEIGARAAATCEVVEDLGGNRFRLTTTVEDDGGDTVLDGEAVVLVDEPPATSN